MYFPLGSKNLSQFIKHMIQKDIWKQLGKVPRTARKTYFHFLARHLAHFASDDQSGLAVLFEELAYSPKLIIRGYTQGIFPSAYAGDGCITWHDPAIRGYLPIHDFHIPRNIQKVLRQERFELRVNNNLQAVIEGCAEERPKTHINAHYIDVYLKLHAIGLVHAVSAWEDDKLVGGTYGIAIGAYFASESAFHRVRDASKVATVRLTEILAAGGFLLHDTWWFAKDIEQFGGGSLSHDEFHKQHFQALITPAQFNPNTPRTFSTGCG
jgi:leucyl/phenylalanyl-tRNA---protein transferase